MMLNKPDQIALYRLITLRSGLKLEMRGMKVKGGKSCYSIIRQELGLKGDRTKVLDQLQKIIDDETTRLEAEL